MPRGRTEAEVKASFPPEWRDLPLFSYSQLTTADRCDFLWYIKYGLRQKSGKNSPRLDMGSFTHTFLADLYQCIADQGMTAHDWVQVRMNVVLMEIMDSLNFDDQISAAAKAMQLIQRYVRSDVLAGHTPVGIEMHFAVLVTPPSGRSFVLQGYVDLITIDSHGQIWVWDHETADKLWPPRSIKTFLQLPLYQMLLRADGINVHGVMVNRLNSYIYKDMDAQPDAKLFKREPKIWTPGQLENIRREFIQLAESTLDLMEGKRPARRSISSACFNCDMVGGCFANLEGEDLVESLQVNHDRQVAFRSMPAGSSITYVED